MTDQQPSEPFDGPCRRGGDRRQSDNDRRESVVDRRAGADRRGTRTGLERLRGPGRRRSEFAKSAEEGEMSTEQFLFIMAVDAYKRVNNTPFPTWTEVLEIIRKIGYRKTMPCELNLPNTEDWSEEPDTPAMPAPADTDDAEADDSTLDNTVF